MLHVNFFFSLDNENEDKSEGDHIQSAIGEIGRWQLIICLALSLSKIPVAWHQLSIIFLAPPVTAKCISGKSIQKFQA